MKDDYGGTTESNKTDTIPIKLSDATAAEWAKRPIDYHTGYTLLPGKHTIKVLARDDVTGTIGTFQTSFIIPNLIRRPSAFPSAPWSFPASARPPAKRSSTLPRARNRPRRPPRTRWCRTG